MPNHLQFETSPYLIQHANNPVDWYPWGAQALAVAVREDKPILLSIGYAACHWCHVMERECFEDEAIAAEMNRLFVCIKVDREERPDLDKIYQSAHQMLASRPGGWPLTLALTPKGHAPFFAGTYFPPAPHMGMPGFAQVLARVAAHYRQHHAQMQDHCHAFQKALAKLNPQPLAQASDLPDPNAVLGAASAELLRQFDREFGGFGDAPKFPHPTQLALLLRHGHAPTPDPDAQTAAQQSLRCVDFSLRKMAESGLFDQLGGGFFRYSVDRQWRIPHFEKMLYDNAQLLGLYADAWQSLGAPLYQRIVAQTANWLMHDMQQPDGGFASTLDADSEGVEGKYYVWSETDLRALLAGDEYAALENYYQLAGEPNFEGNWHLVMAPHTRSDDAVPEPLQRAQTRLLAARSERVRPLLDDKILTAWNGLMLKGLARAGVVFGRDDFIESAQRALDLLRAKLWDGQRLRVTRRDGKTRLNGYLDDYAFLAEGIVELLQARWRSGDLAFAIQLGDCLLQHFEDPEHGGFFFTSHDHETLLHRPKSGADDAIPSGNASAVRALYQLGVLLGDTRYLESAEKALRVFAPALQSAPSVYAALSAAFCAFSSHPPCVILRGGAEQIQDWRRACRKNYHPDLMLFAIPDTAAGLPETLALRAPQADTVAYLCRGRECTPPLTSLEDLQRALAG